MDRLPTTDEETQVRETLSEIGAVAPKFQAPATWTGPKSRSIVRPLLAAAAIAVVAGLGVSALGKLGSESRLSTASPSETSFVDAPRTPVKYVRAGVNGKSKRYVGTLDDLRKHANVVLGTVLAARVGQPSGVADDSLLPNLLTVRIDEQLTGSKLPPQIELWVQYTDGDVGIVGAESQPWLEPGDEILIGLTKEPSRTGVYGAVGSQAIFRFLDGRIVVPGDEKYREPLVDIFDGLTRAEAIQRVGR